MANINDGSSLHPVTIHPRAVQSKKDDVTSLIQENKAEEDVYTTSGGAD